MSTTQNRVGNSRRERRPGKQRRERLPVQCNGKVARSARKVGQAAAKAQGKAGGLAIIAILRLCAESGYAPFEGNIPWPWKSRYDC